MTKKITEKLLISPEEAGQRLDLFLSSFYPDLSRSALQKHIKAGYILLNNSQQKSSTILKTDDTIDINIDLESTIKIEPENIPIEVLYEDEQIAVINKPCEMLTHPTSIEKEHTLVNALLYKFGNNLSDCNGDFRPGIVHRLDRNTSGLLMIAKTNQAYEFLKEKMQNREIEKKYYAIVCGNIENDTGTISTDIGRHPNKPEKMAVVLGGKPSTTHYKVIERFSSHTLLDITLETGRTHQIRVHMAYINHPIVNDTMYGGSTLPVKTNEQVLQAYSLKFISPYDNKERIITIDFDNDIIKVLNYLRSKK